MATTPVSRKLNLTRDQLAAFLTDHQQIKQFELLFSVVDTLEPIIGTDFVYQADTAAANANNALAQISALAQDTAVDDAVLNAKVQQALDAIPRLAQAIDLLSTAPRQEIGTIAPQNSDNVNITGGLISGLDAPLPVASGGIGVITTAANLVFAGPTSGIAAPPAFRTLIAADIPSLTYLTSVGLSAPTGFSVVGSPVTSSGTLALSFAAGYSLPTNASQTNWDTAYSERRQWDGGSTSLVAATGRTSLGASTVGSNLFTLTNPNAITFLRINADNSVSTLDATTFRTAIGAGTGSGTVTSVATGTGLTGGPITGTGTVSFAVAAVGTWAATPSSANLAAAMTDETGSGSLVFATRPSFSNTIGVGGAAAAASGAGVSFPATQSASTDPNTLDDYEEGTWVPTLTGWTGTLAGYACYYTKIGRLVHVWGVLIPSTTLSSVEAVSYVTGLPFNPVSDGPIVNWCTAYTGRPNSIIVSNRLYTPTVAATAAGFYFSSTYTV